jgi:hypothetical protein
MEPIHVELPDKAVHLAVAEEAREDDLLKFVDILDHELGPGGRPINNLGKLLILV